MNSREKRRLKRNQELAPPLVKSLIAELGPDWIVSDNNRYWRGWTSTISNGFHQLELFHELDYTIECKTHTEFIYDSGKSNEAPTALTLANSIRSHIRNTGKEDKGTTSPNCTLSAAGLAFARLLGFSRSRHDGR